jgi:hypothetical protein
MRHATGAKAADASAAEATDASAEATDVSAAKASHMTSAKAPHVASATPAMSAAAAAATAAGLCARGKPAAGKHCACQNHHHSSSHDILHLNGRIFRLRPAQTLPGPSKEASTWR